MNKRRRILRGVLIGTGFSLAILIGITLGLAISATKNIQNLEQLQQHKPALPTQILDIQGRLITQFFSDEKREIVSINEFPKSLIQALLTREDQYYYDHHGFRIMYILGAAWDIITGRSFRGGSTLTQQLAGYIYADRTDISLKRKLVELWWAIQLERALTKNEILERYLNLMYFGHNTYGVEAASQFYFKHSVRQNTLAESVILVIQLANPGRYSPINHPNRAKKLQREILYQMVELGYTTQEKADLSFQEYWQNYDFTRSNMDTAWMDREDRAPYFSEYVRQRLEEQLFGAMDLYKEGLVVHTTLNLDYQEIADQVMDKRIRWVNRLHHEESDLRISYTEDYFLPIVDLLALSFNIEDIRFTGSKQKAQARDIYLKELNPIVDVVSMIFGVEDLKFASRVGYAREAKKSKETRVEGALVSIDARKGYILAMVGGRKFESTNQFNRAAQAQVQPGSAFKPLYYSAAISSRKLTPASLIMDKPVVFWNDDNTPYIPLNYKGEWKGPVLLRYALAHSMNIPSLKVLDSIGFDAAITRASRMLSITDPADIERIFPRKYPLGLGVITVSPLQMARAFSTFPNEGRAVEPIAIRYVEDRNGRLILEQEKELRSRQMRAGESQAIMSPQAAYIMLNMLQSTVSSGTLRYAEFTVDGFDRPIAGKTGTTQNWSDAWTVGFTPQITTAVWFGFDEGGHSLGINLSGAVSAGPAWADYMKKVHQELPVADFIKPESGLIEVDVCVKSGMLPTSYCRDGTIKEIFLSGTEPREFCEMHKYESEQKESFKENLKSAILFDTTTNFTLPEVNIPILDELDSTEETQESGPVLSGNPLLD